MLPLHPSADRDNPDDDLHIPAPIVAPVFQRRRRVETPGWARIKLALGLVAVAILLAGFARVLP